VTLYRLDNCLSTVFIQQFTERGEKHVMYRNQYGTNIESWKVDLVLLRGRRMGFNEHDLADLQQQIAITLQNFLFDPGRANGAAESTVLVAVIDRQLKTAKRKTLRYQRRFKQIEEREEQVDHSSPKVPHYEDRGQMQMDVTQALEKLNPRDRQLCRSLASGETIHQIAQSQNCGWHTVKRRIERIRNYFQQIGLDGWLDR
jgi:RNA polymerase sigma factor (sigma-70 family)